MFGRRILPLFLAFPALATGCLKGDKGGGSSSPPRPWAFANADTPELFQPKLARLGAMLKAAGRTAPEAGSLGLRGEKPAGCETPVGILGLEAPPTAPARGLGLAESTSCDGTVATLRAHYIKALGLAARSAFMARDVRPGVIYCGLRVTDAEPALAVAAIGRRYEAIDLPSAARFTEELLGGSNDHGLALQTRVLAGCDATRGDCGKLPEGLTGWVVEGVSDLGADFDAGTVAASNDYALAYQLGSDKGAGALNGRLRTQALYSGLGVGEKAKAVEHVELLTEGTGALGLTAAGDGAAALDLTVEEVGPGQVRLSGSVFSGSGAPAQDPFVLALTERDGACVVDVDPMPGPSTEPAVTLAPEQIVGEWQSDCVTGPLGRFGAGGARQELLTFQNGRFAHKLLPFGDGDCFTGREAARVELFGSYTAAPLVSPATDLGLDYAYETLHVTLHDAAVVEAFNQGVVCGRHDWKSGETRIFAAGACYFDLGGSALMTVETLKRTREYSSARADAAGVVGVARVSHFTGDVEELRAMVGAGAVKLRKM